jgi:uncharacterized protein DUF6431
VIRKCAFATAVIVFIPWNDAEGKSGEMVRICPACQQVSVIGHGWRDRQAHDANHSWIRIQRGICKLCDRTLTMLPDWLVPGGHYSLRARQQTVQLASQPQRTVEQCIPASADPNRSADRSTVRRWWQRQWEGLWLSLLGKWAPPPTPFAWDWKAASRILIPEMNSA